MLPFSYPLILDFNVYSNTGVYILYMASLGKHGCLEEKMKKKTIRKKIVGGILIFSGCVGVNIMDVLYIH